MFKKIVKTMIVTDDSRKSATSVVGRGVVGGILTTAVGLGPVGLLAAASAKNKKTATFVIEYSDGTRETKTVKTKSSEFKKLAKFLEM